MPLESPKPPDTPEICRLLIEQASGHAIMVFDAAGSIRFWSAGAQRAFGHTSAQILGRSITELFTAEDRERGMPELEMRIAASGTSSEDDRWHVRADGSRFWSNGTMDSIRDAQGNVVGFVKILRDRTNMREQLEMLANRVEALAAERDRQEMFVTTLSHELRNLVSALTHGLRLLQRPDAGSPAPEKLMRLMQDQVQLVRRISEDLLDAERLKMGRLSIRTSRVILQDILVGALDALRPRISARELRVDLLEPGSPIVVAGDPDRLVQVFGNILGNAVKYTPDGGRIWIKATIEDPDAVVHIEDNGIGIPPDMLSRIFDLFTQVPTHLSHQGLGIGLALVRDLVTLHNGSVQARSEGPGHGSEFTVRLPLLPE